VCQAILFRKEERKKGKGKKEKRVYMQLAVEA
jgi:hypothetical protein